MYEKLKSFLKFYLMICFGMCIILLWASSFVFLMMILTQFTNIVVAIGFGLVTLPGFLIAACIGLEKIFQAELQ